MHDTRETGNGPYDTEKDAEEVCADRILEILLIGDRIEVRKALMAAYLNGVVDGTLEMATVVRTRSGGQLQ